MLNSFQIDISADRHKTAGSQGILRFMNMIDARNGDARQAQGGSESHPSAVPS